MRNLTISCFDHAIIIIGFFGVLFFLMGFAKQPFSEAMFLSAGIVGTLYTTYRIVRGVADPDWLDAEDTPKHESIDPELSGLSSEDDDADYED